jgi:glycine betaine catabolism B
MTRWLDQITGRVTMYRLVLLCLLALVVEALLVSLTGQLPPYNAIGILVAGIVAVGVSYLSDRVFALIFRVKPHSESSLVTGLILLFLFNPLLDLTQLLAIALAALLANASKYLLAIRGRHIFNPAAVGAFLVSLILPLNSPGWWVATPWLLPLVVLFALVILFRTRHLLMGLVFVVVTAAMIVTITLASITTSINAAIGTAFDSFPIVFFAGFMLSEPLTLPPRRWQQLVEAVIVALLFGLETVGFHLGPVYASPLIALLIGNAFAFAFGQRRGIRLDYLGSTPLTPTSLELSFRPQRPIAFRAGQFMELTLPHSGADVRGLRRTFSIASAPVEQDIIRFGLRRAERSSSFKTALLALNPGETVTATAVGGDFLLPKDDDRPLLLVASGIGITPYMSHLTELAQTNQKRDVVLVYSASSAEELAYADRLKELDVRVLVVAPTEPNPLPHNWNYLGRGPVTAELITERVPDARNRATYISGPPSLVHTLRPALRKARVHSIRTDYFSGY